MFFYSLYWKMNYVLTFEIIFVFLGLILDYSPYGIGEQTVRDAQYETAAVLDHYFYQENVAPFLCTRIIQRFGFSNPSPRRVSACTNAFRTGNYTSGSETFGSGEYGSLCCKYY